MNPKRGAMHLARRRDGAALGDGDFWRFACTAKTLTREELRRAATILPADVDCGACKRTAAFRAAERIAAETGMALL